MSISLSSLVDSLSEIYKKNANHARKEKESCRNAVLTVLKIIDCIKNVKNVVMNHMNQ